MSPTHWADAFERYWNELLAGGLQVNIPDPLLADVIRASLVHCYLAARNQENGRYVEPWVGAMAFGPIDLETSAVVRGMDMCGQADFARRGLNYLLDKRYNYDGYFTTGYTLSGMGINLWVTRRTCCPLSGSPVARSHCAAVGQGVQVDRRAARTDQTQRCRGAQCAGIRIDAARRERRLWPVRLRFL